MLRNNPRHVTDSVKEATEVFGGMFNTHKCLLESGMEIKKRLESQLTSKKADIFRRQRTATLGDTPKKLTKRGRGFLLFSPRIGFLRKGRVAHR